MHIVEGIITISFKLELYSIAKEFDVTIAKPIVSIVPPVAFKVINNSCIKNHRPNIVSNNENDDEQTVLYQESQDSFDDVGH